MTRGRFYHARAERLQAWRAAACKIWRLNALPDDKCVTSREFCQSLWSTGAAVVRATRGENLSSGLLLVGRLADLPQVERELHLQIDERLPDAGR